MNSSDKDANQTDSSPLESDSSIASTKRIAGFTGWNLVGMCAPMLVAFFSIPFFVKGLGTERFGALTLVWMLVGYFSILDMGMGRAMTKLTAEYLGTNRRHLMANVFWTAIIAMGLFGIAGAILIACSSAYLTNHILNIAPALQNEIHASFLVASAAIPFTVAVTGLIGVLETHQYFRLINIVRIPIGIATYTAPLLVIPFSNSLVPVVSVLISIRILELAIYFAFCLIRIPVLRERIVWDASMIKPLFTFGGWMTASNIALPLMIQIDRMIIGAVQSLADVAYYANPSEIVIKLLILPRSWVSAIFPPMTMLLARQSAEADALFARSVKMLLIVMFPVALAICAIAPEFLTVWLNPEFSKAGAHIMQILTAGIFIYSLSYLAFSLLQSAGRPDLSAKWHIFELPVFLLFAWGATRQWGITGMAWTWAIRGTIDAVVLFALSLRYVPTCKSAIFRCGTMTIISTGLMLVASFPSGLLTRLTIMLFSLVSFTAVAWFWLLQSTERDWATRFILRWRPTRVQHKQQHQ